MTQHTDEEYNVLYEWVIEVANQNQSLYIQRTTGELRIAALENERYEFKSRLPYRQ